MNSSRSILVTGGTGRQGGTGRSVVRHLVGLGFSVRALVRNLDARADHLTGLGAEVVVGDYADHQSLLRALDGIESAYFCHPVGSGICEAAGLFAAAARHCGLEHLVDLSLAAARPDSPSPQGRAQWVAESIFEWAGLKGVHLRIAAFFMENLLYLDAESIRQQDLIANAFGEHPLAWISGEDVGAIAAALIADPDACDARTLVAGGVERRNYPEIADLIAASVGRPIAYQELSPEDWRDAMVAASRAADAENARGAAHLAAQAVALRRLPPLPVTTHVQDVAGREPILLPQFIANHKSDFEPRKPMPRPAYGTRSAAR